MNQHQNCCKKCHDTQIVFGPKATINICKNDQCECHIEQAREGYEWKGFTPKNKP